ncbi:hypothetical protein [uncultured Imperialibacter sp.]|uniref:hypothetical protein n=1 Tax=uncultured Imperialibacter sp. TaxID=1672639 RepID=UPI0030D6DEDB|tara:strand:- start:52762 stop:53193 length:432 start_codon:yes stop_codon:yes gene_type:complete
MNRIRTSLFTLAAAATLFFTGCKDDNGDASSPLVGTWTLVKTDISGCTNGGNGTSTFTCDDANCLTITMKADNSYQMKTLVNGGVTNDNGTYLLMGDNLEVCRSNGTVCSNGDFALNTATKSFTLTEVDGATGCTRVTTYKKV